MPHVVKTPAPLDLNDIQGDILDGLPKKAETFFFFHINVSRIQQFRTQLTELIPLITTSAQCQDDRHKITEEKRKAERNHTTPALLEISAVNIAFSQKGLNQMSINDDIGDTAFKAGMQADAQDLGDDLTKWDEKFKQEIHGVILITGSTPHKIQETLTRVKTIFSIGHHHGGATIREVLQLDGHSRPGKFDGHEHFGFNDGISQPAIDGLKSTAHRGQETVNQGVIFIGREGDNGAVEAGKSPAGVKRPTWAQDGSFLCFRYLQQLVPEFNKFLEDNALPVPEPRAPEDPSGSELLGARLVGRWKSGAPVDITPIRDDPSLSQSDAFRYDPTSQERCPFAAHTRKMNPRSDLDSFGGTEVRRIIRRGIQFGPEVTDSEAASHKSSTHARLERGLLFVCYQSNIVNGFQFLQHSWANQPTFPPKQEVPKPGFDPIIGVGKDRELVGTNPKVASTELSLPQDWVVPRGGEYFFSPSISALRNTFALRETFAEAA